MFFAIVSPLSVGYGLALVVSELCDSMPALSQMACSQLFSGVCVVKISFSSSVIPHGYISGSYDVDGRTEYMERLGFVHGGHLRMMFSRHRISDTEFIGHSMDTLRNSGCGIVR